jgi:pimeloyl-ACP methyl ester carboxylesterase
MIIFKWIIFIVIVLVIGIVIMLSIGSFMSLDRQYTHTKKTETAPLLSEKVTAGIVRIEANGHAFRARVAGLDRAPAEAPTVILLHGFPVTSAMWEPLISPLSKAGYRVIAFDQRGYSPGARPKDPTAYTVPNLVSDVIAIADAVGAEQFHLMGHDWGAAVGWGTVMQHPKRTLSWTGISIAHPAAFADAVQNDPDQRSRSRYFLLFITPYLPEALFTFNNLAMLKGLYESVVMDQKQEYLEVFSEPGALTAALNWYRQMKTQTIAQQLTPEIHTPTLFIWGNKDPYVGAAAIEGQAKYMKGPYNKLELDGGHWLVERNSERVIPAVLEHLAANK